jgi:hypothetical protein
MVIFYLHGELLLVKGVVEGAEVGEWGVEGRVADGGDAEGPGEGHVEVGEDTELEEELVLAAIGGAEGALDAHLGLLFEELGSLGGV